MTSIGGILYQYGRPLPPQAPGAMQSALASRGIQHWWVGDQAAFGGSCLAVVGHASTGLVIAADARLDNYRELISTLGLDKRIATTAQIIGAAYRRWGASSPAQLLGDFSFIVWDQSAGRLFAARDHFGVRPFYYSAEPKQFIFGSTMSAIRSVECDPTYDKIFLSDFVAGRIGDMNSTLYETIKRLPPGHSLTLDDSGHRVQPYWRLEPVLLSRMSPIADQFRALFEDAVTSRMADEPSLGLMLSGGLDSSSIAMVAAQSRSGKAERLQSFSMTFDAMSGWSDRTYLAAVVEAGAFASHRIPSDDYDPFAELDVMLDEQEGPFLAYNHAVSRRIYACAAERGVTCLLDGHGGDEIISQGFGRLNELAQAGRWFTLWKEAAAAAAVFEMSRWSVISPYLAHNRSIRRIRSRMASFSRPAAVRGGGTTPISDLDLVSPELAARTDLKSRADVIPWGRRGSHTEKDLHLAILSAPIQPYALEVLDRASAAAGISTRYPFYDRRLAEFCVSLESSEKLRDGMPRAILRDAMKDLLPEPVRLRRDKFDFSAQLHEGIARHISSIDRTVFRQNAGLNDYVDMGAAHRSMERVKHGQALGVEYRQVWRLFVLARWLQRKQERFGIHQRQSSAVDRTQTS